MCKLIKYKCVTKHFESTFVLKYILFSEKQYPKKKQVTMLFLDLSKKENIKVVLPFGHNNFEM